jgi:tryptophan synthase alpha chain
MAVAGLTGERAELPQSLSVETGELRQVSGLPICVGFGISNAAQVRAVCEFADGAIVGSAIVRRIAEALRAGVSNEEIVGMVGRIVGELMAGTLAATADD